MIPAVRSPDFEFVEPPSKTWRLDFAGNRTGGVIDGLEAVAQAALLALQTERYRYLIYSWQYGSELQTLLGKDDDYVFSEAKRMIADALRNDSRIKAVRDFTVKNKVLFFTLETIFGSKQMETEVLSE